MRVQSLIWLGLSGQDFGPCYADEWTHQEFAAKWRGTVACPTEAQILAASPPQPTFAQIRDAEKAIWMEQREKMCARLASIASRLYISDPAASASCDAVASSLLGLFTDPAVEAATTLAGYRAALKATYDAATAHATPAALAEFARYDK